MRVYFKGEKPCILLILPTRRLESDGPRLVTYDSTYETYLNLFPSRYLLAVYGSGYWDIIEKMQPWVIAIAELKKILYELNLVRNRRESADRLNRTFAEKVKIKNILHPVWVIYIPSTDRIDREVINDVLKSLRVQMKFAAQMRLYKRLLSWLTEEHSVKNHSLLQRP